MSAGDAGSAWWDTGDRCASVLVDLEQEAHVVVITLNRPKVRNAVDADVAARVGTALDRADSDPRVRVIVVTGAGERAFCAGADLKAVARGEAIVAPGHEDWGFAGYVSHAVRKPTIAAINGYALGGGLEIAMASDLAVMATTATLGLPEVKRGLIAGGGGTFRLPSQIATKPAMEMLLTGKEISATRAYSLGLVNRVVEPSDVLAEALALAREVAESSPSAVQATKRLAYGMVGDARREEADAWTRSAAELDSLKRIGDYYEGVRAFVEKRQPSWKSGAPGGPGCE